MTWFFKAVELAECAEREVKQRKRVYAFRVSAGHMTHEFAAVQIAMMERIAADYREKAKAEEPQGELL